MEGEKQFRKMLPREERYEIEPELE